MSANSKSNEIRISRVYDAPVKAVWDAWTDPKQVAMWWGPRGFTITTHSKDLRPGGSWKYTMHGPDGIDYPNITHYYEVEKCSKLVYDHGANETQPAKFRVTVLFSEASGKTKMEMTMTLATVEEAEETRRFIKSAGGNATWDRLAEYLEKEISGKEQFVIARSFDAPIERLFDLWTNPEHVARWLPPTGAQMKFFRANIQPGGSSFYVMNAPYGTLHGRAEYLEIEKPNRIVYLQQFCDENEKLSRHPLSPTWPETMKTTVTLTAESSDRTRVSVTWEAHGNVSSEELTTFVKARAGMTQGWTGSFDKLDEIVAAS
ncbi:MAG TPA: SRPBCC family protein [Polyangiaceae bacterium]|nr:SRPBCC family protein [Polyangiaceae bacterium]